MLTKDLLFIDPEVLDATCIICNLSQDETPVKNFISIFGRSVQVVWPDQKLGDVSAFVIGKVLSAHSY